jgi:enoyl-CoA hydratase
MSEHAPKADEAPILFRQQGAAGIITLNRPRQLNALNPEMVALAHPVLARWKHDPTVTRVIIRGSGDKAFCAGGDIRLMHKLGTGGQREAALDFWREEYRLNRVLHTYPKPVVALMDGIVMGGGVGLSCHGSHRVATERLVLAMPEVAIGFFPDVGAAHLLGRLPGAFGRYLAVTGERVGLGDALALGLVTHAIDAADIAAVEQALTGTEPVEACLAPFLRPTPPGPLLAARARVDALFGHDSIPAILQALEGAAADDPDLAGKALASMRHGSPLSEAIALEQVKRGAGQDLDAALRQDMRIVTRIAAAQDFYEGVRALLIDKDNAPRWQPARHEEVTAAMVAAYFEPLPRELDFEGL